MLREIGKLQEAAAGTRDLRAGDSHGGRTHGAVSRRAFRVDGRADGLPAKKSYRHVNEIGPRVSQSIREFFDEPKKRGGWWSGWRDAGLTFSGKKETTRHAVQGKDVRSHRNFGATPRATRPRKLIEDAGGQSGGIGEQEDGLRSWRERKAGSETRKGARVWVSQNH